MIRPALISLLLASPAMALDLPVGAVMTGEDTAHAGNVALPVGPWREGAVETLALQGAVSKQAWRIGGSGQTTTQLMDLLRGQLQDDGYEILFTCDQNSCGGFDFRFATKELGEPAMHVDLGDFRFLSAGRQDSHVSLLISRSPGAGYVQIVTIDAGEDPAPVTVTSSMANGTLPEIPIEAVGKQMEHLGFAELSDLVFATGSSNLGEGDFPSLAELAAYLVANPDKRITLVGHTDAVGSLAANTALSKQRAGSVRQRLVDRYGVPGTQVAADGIGFLSPIATNQSEEGRERNRRVEVILTTTE